MAPVRRALALLWLRWRIINNGLRSVTGVVNTVSSLAVAVLAALGSLGLATIAAVVIRALSAENNIDGLRISYMVTLFVISFVVLLLPLLTGSQQASLDLERLTVYPMSRREIYGISLVATFANGSSVFFYPTLLTVLVFGVLLPGDGVALGPLLLASFVVVQQIWLLLLMLSFDAALRRRTVREIAAVLGIVAVIAASLLPAGLRAGTDGQGFADLVAGRNVPSWIIDALMSTPPSLTALGLAELHAGASAAVQSLLWLAVWAAVGVAVGYAIQWRLQLGGGSSAQANSVSPKVSARSPLRFDWDLADVLPADLAALAAKEFHYLMRSVVGKLNLLIVPIFAAVVAATFNPEASTIFGLETSDLMLYAMMLYAMLFSSNILMNTFGWDGGGVRAYFLSPIPLGRVLLGKNIGTWLYNGVLLIECLLVWMLIRGLSLTALVTAPTIFTIGLLSVTTLGNFLSVLFPIKRSISSVTSSPSRVAILASLGTVLVDGALVAGILILSRKPGIPLLQPLAMIALLVSLVIVYALLLRPASELLSARREKLLEIV